MRLLTALGQDVEMQPPAARPRRPGAREPLNSSDRWIADNTAYREQLPEDSQKILDEHEAAGPTDSPEYQEAVEAFYRRHLNRMDPWPEELNRAFELANFDLYVTIWGNTEFNATGTLKDFDVPDDLGRSEAPALMICGEYDETTLAACRDFAAKIPNAGSQSWRTPRTPRILSSATPTWRRCGRSSPVSSSEPPAEHAWLAVPVQGRSPARRRARPGVVNRTQGERLGCYKRVGSRGSGPDLVGVVRTLSWSKAWLGEGTANPLLSMISCENRDGAGRAGHVGVRSARGWRGFDTA
jgi:hypothetical protein